MKRVAMIAVLVAIALLSAACGGPPEPANITIELDEYSFAPDEIELFVGQEVTLTLVNVGELDHEFMVGRIVTTENGQPSGYRVDFFAEGGVTPAVSGGGMLMDHSEGHHEDEMDHADEMDHDDMDHSEDEMDHADEMDHDDMDHSEEDMSDMMGTGVNMISQPAGSDSTTVSFTVTEEMLGEWQIGCFLLDGVHFTSGMVGTLVVRQ